MPHIVDLVMGIIGEAPPSRGERKNGADKFIEQQGDYDRHEPSEDVQKKVERHNMVPKMEEELDKRGTTGVVQMANSKFRPHAQVISHSRYFADKNNKSIRFIRSCPACQKLKKFVELQRLSLKPPCKQKSEHKRGVAKRTFRQMKKYPCSSRRYSRRNKRTNDKFRRQHTRRGQRTHDGRNTEVSILSSNISKRSRQASQASSREELPNDDDDSEEPMVES